MTSPSTDLAPAPRANHPDSEHWIILVRVMILLALIPALWFGTIPIAASANNAVIGLFGGYAFLLALGSRWLPPARRTDLVIAADIVVITVATLASGTLRSPLIYLYYLAVIEAAARFNFRQSIAASLAMAAMIALLWAVSRRLPLLDMIGLRQSAFMAGGFLLAVLLGALVQEARGRGRRPQAAAPATSPPSGATAPIEEQFRELQFGNELSARLSGEPSVKSVLRILLKSVLEATGLTTGAAYLITEDGVPQFAAALGAGTEEDREPVGLTFPALPADAIGGEVLIHRPAGESGRPSVAAAYVPLVQAGSLRAWLCAMGTPPASFAEPVVRRVQGIATRGVASLDASRLREEVQRMTRINPARSLYPWNQLQRLITDEIRRSTELVLAFSLAEIRLIDSGGTSWAGGRDGDLALRRVVKLLQTSLRRVDVVSHDGAGRFILLLSRMPKAQAPEILQRLVEKVEEDPLAARLLESKHLTVVVGLVTFPEDGNTASELLETLKNLITHGPSTPDRVRVPSR